VVYSSFPPEWALGEAEEPVANITSTVHLHLHLSHLADALIQSDLVFNMNAVNTKVVFSLGNEYPIQEVGGTLTGDDGLLLTAGAGICGMVSNRRFPWLPRVPFHSLYSSHYYEPSLPSAASTDIQLVSDNCVEFGVFGSVKL
jgi:hypothetical protein